MFHYRFFPTPKFFKRCSLNFFVERFGLQVCSNHYSFYPIFWFQVVVVKHVCCFNNCAIQSFGHSILLGCIWHWCLMLNFFQFKKCSKFSRLEFTFVVTFQDLDLFSNLSFYKRLELLEFWKARAFQNVNEGFMWVIVCEKYIVFRSTKRWSLNWFPNIGVN